MLQPPLDSARVTDNGTTGIGRPRVLVVSDVRIVRDSLLGTLRERGAEWDVGSGGSIDDVFPRDGAPSPDVVLLDMSMAGALTLPVRLAAVAAPTRVVAFAALESDAALLACIERGIVGFVPRDASAADVVATIDAALGGETRLSPRLTASLIRRLASVMAGRDTGDGAASLTARERQILQLIDEGLSNKQIAARLLIELATVKNHVHSILEKTGTRRRSEAAARIRGAHRGR